jgi:CheY-like chemotaxis protein
MSDKPRLLWTDDEGPGRFLYAAMRLEREGWEITWARSVTEAAKLLKERPFDALVLDQMLPIADPSGGATVWGGCTLYRWLRGSAVAAGVPANLTAPAFQPLRSNQKIPVAIVSAYRHDDVEHATNEATSDAASLAWIGKPLDLEAVRRAIRVRSAAR